MIKFKYLYKTLNKFRENPKNKILRFINIDYIAILILGVIFTLGFWLKPIDLSTNIKEYNLFTYSLLSFFILQKNNFIITNYEKNNFLARFSISKYKIHLIDNVILFKESLISIFIFNLPLTIYLLSLNPHYLLGVLFSLIIISISSMLTCEVMKNIILLFSKLSSFIYKIKKVLLTSLFSILYFFILRYPEILNNNQYFIFYYFDLGYKIISNGFNINLLFIYFGIVLSILIIYFGLFPFINIISYKSSYKKISKREYSYNKTYQEFAIKGITNSLIKNDQVLKEALLNQFLEFIFRFIWINILLYSSKAFVSFNNVLFIASCLILFSLGRELDILLIKTKSKLSNQFRVLNNYRDKKIIDEFLKNTILFKAIFFLLPLISINLFFNDLLNAILIIILLIFIFTSSYYFHYLFIKKEILFSYKYIYDRPISGKIIFVNLGLMIYLFLMFTKEKITLFSLIIPSLLFLVPFILFIHLLFNLKFYYYPQPIRQKDNYSCGRIALDNLLFFYNKEINTNSYSISLDGDSIYGIIELAKNNNVYLNAYQDVQINDISSSCIALIKQFNTNHYVVISEIQKKHFIIIDSLKNKTYSISKKRFSKKFNNIIIK